MFDLNSKNIKIFVYFYIFLYYLFFFYIISLSDTDRLPQFNEVVVENRQMLDSFAVISSELRTLAQNLKNAEDLQEKLRIEKREADEKLKAARMEMAAAEAAREEAENAKKIAEKLAAETLEKATIEAKRLKEERKIQKVSTPPPSFSVSAQTEKIETDQSYVKEMITSATIKKEIHILQKVTIDNKLFQLNNFNRQ